MFTRPRWISLISALALLGAPLISACGGSGSHHQTTVNLKRKGLQRRRNQVTWTATLTGSLGRDVSKLAVDHVTDSGRWNLVFNAKTVTLTNPRQAPAAAGELMTGTHTGLSGGRMRFAADPKCPNQTKPTPGLYTYRVSGDRLSVTEVGHNDSCRLRVKALTTKMWTKE